MKKTKIAFVSHFSHFRMGGQQSMLALIENLDWSRFDIYAIVPAEGELSSRLKALKVKVSIIPLTSLKPMNFFKIINNIRRIRKLIKTEEIDILHTDFERDTYVCGWAKRNLPVKLIWHVRLVRPERLDMSNAAHADGIIGISRGTKKRFMKVKGIDEKFTKIFNGVDVAKFSPSDDKLALRQKLLLPVDKKIVLFVGQIKDSKGVMDILDAASLLRDNKNNHVVLFLFIGNFEKENFRETFAKKVKENKINDDVLVKSQQENINEWMAAADMLILPSYEGTEGMGRVLFEAMACGVPVIGTDISGINEAITDDTGILVPEKSPEAIAEAVKKLIDSDELRNELGKNAIKRANEIFDIKVHAKKVEDFYNKILEL